MLPILTAAFTATTIMTLFSYVISWMSRQPFKEPLLLAVLLHNFNSAGSAVNKILGWVLHYMIGLAFSLGFHFLLYAGWTGLNPDSALVYGILTGTIGMAGWYCMFHFSSTQPVMDYRAFYMQLFIAHLFFSFSLVGTLSLLCFT